MLPSLPDVVIERILLHLYEDYEDQTPTLEACGVVCKRWQRFVEPLSWVNQSYSTLFNQPLPAGVLHYINSIQLRDVRQSWVDAHLSPLAPFLLCLDLFSVDPPSQAWSNLRACVNVERLGVACMDHRPGDLHAILDILRFFPRLEQLSLEHFDAPPGSRSKKHKQKRKKAARQSVPFTVSGTFTTLKLASIGGSRPLDLLRTAFDPSFVLTVSSLVLSNLGNTLTHGLINLSHSTLQTLSFDLRTGKGASNANLLPECPLDLHSLTLELPDTPVKSVIGEAYRLTSTLLPYHSDDNLKVGKLCVVVSPTWQERQAKTVLRLCREMLEQLRSFEGFEPLSDKLLFYLNHEEPSAKIKVGWVATGFLEAFICPATACNRYSRTTTLDFLVVEEVLEKGGRLREKLAEKDAAVEAVPLGKE